LAKGEQHLLVANKDGRDEQVFFRTTDMVQAFNWSSEGKSLLLVKRRMDSEGYYWQIVEVDIISGAEKILLEKRRSLISSVVWLARAYLRREQAYLKAKGCCSPRKMKVQVSTRFGICLIRPASCSG
jgi:hypothetical protein